MLVCVLYSYTYVYLTINETETLNLEESQKGIWEVLDGRKEGRNAVILL